MSTQSPTRLTLAVAAAIVALAAISVGMFAMFGRTVVAAPATDVRLSPPGASA